MRDIAVLGAVFFVAPSLVIAQPEAPRPPAGPICGPAPEAAATPATELLSGYGTGGFAISNASPAAQAFFDNGMQLGHAFAHQPAIAAFKEAVRLAPGCAMCVWGEAWSRGPTLNYGISASDRAELAKVADRAASLVKDETPKERALIAALQKRYAKGGDRAFADAMDVLALAYPDDSEIQILAADALMIAADFRNSGDMTRPIRMLEAVLAKNPDDTGAIHFYIHATEVAGLSERAVPYAEKLGRLSPAASHLVHMPSHTYYRVGRYGDAKRSNQAAALIDAANAKRQGLNDPWLLSYHAHNVQFGTGAALMDGDARAALALSVEVIVQVPQLKGDNPRMQGAAMTAYFAQGRYASQPAVAALADPGEKLPLVRAAWRYARGEAAARRGDARAVRAEAALVKVAPEDLKPFGMRTSTASAVVEIARLVLEGRAAMLEKDPAAAAEAFRKAAELQEARLGEYGDPPAWWYPVRRSYAAALLEAGKPQEAAREAQASLKRFPNDALALVVLGRAEAALGRKADADRRLAEARRGWPGDPAAMPAGLL